MFLSRITLQERALLVVVSDAQEMGAGPGSRSFRKGVYMQCAGGECAMTSEAVVLIGVIGSGKSTYADLMRRLKYEIVNKDDIRRSMHDGEYVYDEKLEPQVRSTAHLLILQHLRDRKNICIDETNITRAKRKELVDLIRSEFNPMQVRITFVEFARGPWCLERRHRDARGIPAQKWTEVYERMMRDFEEVKDDEGYSAYKLIDNKENIIVVEGVVPQYFTREKRLDV